MQCFIQLVSIDKLNSLLQKRQSRIKHQRLIDVNKLMTKRIMIRMLAKMTIILLLNLKQNPTRYFIFDIECTQDEEFQIGQFTHQLHLCAELEFTTSLAIHIVI